jgi:uncharacterized repeat protein (TIGR01451 family)
MKRSSQWQRLLVFLALTILAGVLVMALPVTTSAFSLTPLLQDPLPTIEIAKVAKPAQVTEPGGTITFQVKVRNTSGGGLAVTMARLEDNLYGDLLNPGNANISNSTCGSVRIQAGDTYQCTFEVEVVGNAGSSVSDTVTAKVKDDLGNAAQASAQATVNIVAGQQAEITVQKRADPTQVNEPGGTVTFGVRVQNSAGGQPLTLVRLEDNLFGDLTSVSNASISNSTCDLLTIQPGETYQCSFQAEVVGSAGNSVTDTVTAKARDAAGNAVQASAQATVKIAGVAGPGITVEKSANPSQVAEPGGTVTYQVKIRNSAGRQALNLVRLEDNLYGDLTDLANAKIKNSTCGLVTIQPGDTYQCTFQAEVTGNSGSSVTDTVTAKARDASDNVAQASDQATVKIGAQPRPGIEVSKKASPTWVLEPGDNVTYKIRVRNNSPSGLSLTLTGVQDNVYGDLTDLANANISNSTCELVSISSGNSYECTFKAQVSGNAGSTETDTVTVTAKDDPGNQVQASDQATVQILSEPPDTGVPLTPPMIAGGLMALGAVAVAAGALAQRRAS